MDYPYIREQGKSGQMGQKLMAIVAAGVRGRVYLSPTAEMESIAESADPTWRPDCEMPKKHRHFQPPVYGMKTHGGLFTPHQLVALTTFSDWVGEARERIRGDAVAAGLADDNQPLDTGDTGAQACAEAVSVYLAFAVSRMSNYSSTLCVWSSHPKNELVKQVFMRQALPNVVNNQPKKGELASSIAKKLVGVFRPDQLGRLVRRQPGRNRCEIKCHFTVLRQIHFSFNTTSKTEVTIDVCPKRWVEKRPVYLPPRELLTISPGFVSLYENTHLEFEETYRDTCLLLASPLAKGPRETRIKQLLEPIEEAMGGKVESDGTGRFYLKTASGSMEMHLVAEGLRKLAMVARLIATGQLIDKGFLFWDEPEANLNPKVIKSVAKTILHLCRNGIQVFVATHSLFLMRELDILLHPRQLDHDPAPVVNRALNHEMGKELGNSR